MSVHFERELDQLRKKVLSLGAMVEENYQNATEIMVVPDIIKADRVKEYDKEIDRMEIVVEEECLKILALHQPVAQDLRYVICVLKLTHDLERIGDLAVSLTKKSAQFKEGCIVHVINELSAMSRTTQTMLNKALDALIHMDGDLARYVRQLDDEVDNLKKEIRVKMENAIQHDPANTKAYLAAMGAARHLERTADLCTNICADVVYFISGKIIRHENVE